MDKIVRKFRKEDIGGELLPILTIGLYRDVLDTLREYIQNSIDAKAKKIELTIDVDQIVIKDNGTGMGEQDAYKAIRLGISDKNPLENVGFRGIGIYSSFNLCEKAEIYTKHQDDRKTYLITFDFKKIRNEVEIEQEKRKDNKEPELYLEKLLSNAVHINETEEKPIRGHGTLVILSGLNSDVFQKLNNWDEVSAYLEKVVPLPFREDFKYGEAVKEKLDEHDYPLVSIDLQISNRKETLYKSYSNEMFRYGGMIPVKVYPLKTKGYNFGFAWVCINDATAVLKDNTMRGLLIKKFGFSVNERNYLERFFSLSTKYRRITGEIILKHDELIPNAARNDFEHNSTRQAFFEYLPEFISKLTRWIDDVDRVLKALSVLAVVWEEAKIINDNLIKVSRDKEELLKLNGQLMELQKKLNTHKKTLQKIKPDDFDEVTKYLNDCIDFVKDRLTNSKKSRKEHEKSTAAAARRATHEQSEEEKARSKEKFKTLIELIHSLGLSKPEEFLDLISYIDEHFLQEYLTEKDYQDMISELQEYIEGKL